MANQKRPQAGRRMPPGGGATPQRQQPRRPTPPKSQGARPPGSRPAPPRKGKQPPARGKRPPQGKRRPNPPRRPEADPRSRQIQRLQQQRKRKRKRNYTLHYIILFLFLSVTGVVLSLTVFFNIEAIEIRGSGIYTEAEVLPYLEAKVGDNLLRLNTGRLEDSLRRALTQADEVRVNRVFPSRLRVEITDGIPAAQLECGGQYYVLSGGGRVLQIAQELQEENGVLILGVDLAGAAVGDYASAFLERQWEAASQAAKSDKQPPPEKPTQFSDLQALFSALEESRFFDVNAVDVSDSSALVIYWQNRLKIQLGSFSELAYKLKFVRAVLSGEEYQEIIQEDAKGVLDAREISAGLSFRPDNSLELPAEGGKLWSWDSGAEEGAEGDGASSDAPEGSSDGSEASSDAPEDSSEPAGDTPSAPDPGSVSQGDSADSPE